MEWFHKDYEINGIQVQLEGTFEKAILRITAFIEVDPDDHLADWEEHVLYEKAINMWAHQEILAEDILLKYQGMVRKAEKRLSTLVEKHKINKSI